MKDASVSYQGLLRLLGLITIYDLVPTPSAAAADMSISPRQTRDRGPPQNVCGPEWRKIRSAVGSLQPEMTSSPASLKATSPFVSNVYRFRESPPPPLTSHPLYGR